MLLIYLSIFDTEDDKNKFELLYVTYKKLMFYVANHILKDEHLAEDAVYHAFIKIIENFDKVGDVYCYKTKSYIVTIVKNYAINLYNKRKNHVTIPLEEIEYSIADEAVSKIGEMDNLTKAVMKLPIIYKDVLILKYVQEFSNAEIAQTLDISEVTVRKRLERAKTKIQEILWKEEHVDDL